MARRGGLVEFRITLVEAPRLQHLGLDQPLGVKDSVKITGPPAAHAADGRDSIRFSKERGCFLNHN